MERLSLSPCGRGHAHKYERPLITKLFSSFRPKRSEEPEPRVLAESWVPAFAGTTTKILEPRCVPTLVPGVSNALSGDAIADYYRGRLDETQDLQLRCETWMGRAGQVFFEWRMAGSIAGRPFDLGAAERLTLDGSRIVEGVSYFDTLSLRTLHDPSIAPRTIFDSTQQ
jgi:hypothetical protein